MFFWNSCFFDDSSDVGNLISGSSAFSKTSLNILKFTVHILLKPGLENFEHYFASMWDSEFIYGFWYRYIMSCANRDSFTSLLFLIWTHFISISYLTLLAGTSNICWLNVLRKGIHVFFLILAHLFTIKYVSCGFLYMIFIKLSLILFYTQLVKSFLIINGWWKLWNYFLYLLRLINNFFLHFVNVMTDWYADFEPSLHPWNKSH